MTNRTEFQVEKAIAALAYIFENSKADLYAAMKVMYLADRAHLEHYGRFIAGDSYVAMPNGPAPDGAYGMLKAVRGDDPHAVGGAEARAVFGVKEQNVFEVRSRPDYDELSLSDIECIDDAIGKFAEGGWARVRDESHDEAWKSIWGNRATKADPMPIELIAATLGDDVLQHVRDPFPGTI